MRNVLIDNPDFVSQVKARFKTTDVICSSPYAGCRRVKKASVQA
jgi:hypothetical protein